MKFLLFACLAFLIPYPMEEEILALSELGRFESIPKGKSVIYGNFIRRLGNLSGSGYPHEIRIRHTKTRRIFAFVVCPTFSGARENWFCYIIRPGNYEVLNYEWAKYELWGWRIFTEPILKNKKTPTPAIIKGDTTQIPEAGPAPFTFTIPENSVNYLGTWHFDTENVWFSNEKEVLDAKLKRKFKEIDLSNANVELPR